MMTVWTDGIIANSLVDMRCELVLHSTECGAESSVCFMPFFAKIIQKLHLLWKKIGEVHGKKDITIFRNERIIGMTKY